MSVLGFLGIDAQPGVMRQVIFRGSARLLFRELEKVVVKAVGVFPIEAGPKSGFADGLTSGRDHRLIVVSRAADHVAVGLDVAHGGKVRLKVTVRVNRSAGGTKGVSSGEQLPLSLLLSL